MFIYAKEKIKFMEEWEVLLKQYWELKMTEEQIAELFLFDWGLFKKRRNYERYTKPLASKLYSTFDENDFFGRFAWIDTIESHDISKVIKNLSDKDLELLTMLVFEGYTQTEIASIQSCSRNAISKKFKKIKSFF